MPATRRRPFRIPPAMRGVFGDLLQSFSGQVSEIFKNAVVEAVDDALERVEEKVQDGLGRIQRARGVAQKRGRRGRK